MNCKQLFTVQFHNQLFPYIFWNAFSFGISDECAF